MPMGATSWICWRVRWAYRFRSAEHRGPANEPNGYSVIPQGSPAFSGQLWGASIATSTQIAAGTAVVMSVKAGAGIFWQRLGLTIFFNPWSLMTSNEYFWIAEERIAYSSPRPAALNIVTGLPT